VVPSGTRAPPVVSASLFLCGFFECSLVAFYSLSGFFPPSLSLSLALSVCLSLALACWFAPNPKGRWIRFGWGDILFGLFFTALLGSFIAALKVKEDVSGAMVGVALVSALGFWLLWSCITSTIATLAKYYICGWSKQYNAQQAAGGGAAAAAAATGATAAGIGDGKQAAEEDSEQPYTSLNDSTDSSADDEFQQLLK
jgi:hypothetical protein